MSPDAMEVSIHGIGAGGAGVGRLEDGRAVFVHRTAPGDRALVELTAQKQRWARGRVLSIVDAGPNRRNPPCSAYALCGGCTLQHLEYPTQLDWKRQIVEAALSRIGGEVPDTLAITGSEEELGYRTRVTFTLRRLRNGRVVAGLHELLKPARVFDLTGACLIADPALRAVWSGMRAAWGPGARSLPGGGELRLTLRKADEGVVLVIQGGKGDGDPEPLIEEVDGLVAIWHQRERGGAPTLVAGLGDLGESRLGERFVLAGSGFQQVNLAAGDALHRRVLELVGDTSGRVIDAYCGVGALGRALARDGRSVIGIESDGQAARAARSDSPAGFELTAGTVESKLTGLLPSETVIVNPPRAGLDGSVTDALLSAPPQTLVYVSCDAATLARDVRRLSPGFRVAHVELFDLFPQTAHVETLMVLHPGEAV